ncbi:MAG: pilus assembly protein TadG-related protein, partial [Chloroflexota bacterium]|nr:pilus assembly protein TadG-related protein [Chloroflexota bacterium]
MRVRAGKDAGQALILVALAVAVLLGSLALGLDWGYGLTQRRVMQNGADAGTVAAGNKLAQSVIAVTSGGATKYVFAASQEEIFCTADTFARANNSFAPAGGTRTTRVEYGVVADPNNAASWDPPTWVASSVTACTTATSTPVNANTRFVRVRASIQYRAFVAGAVGHPT